MRRFLSVLISVMLVSILVVGIIATSSAQKKIIPGGQYNLTDYQELTRKKITKLNEAPQLRELVEQGKLPSVDKRLPVNPAIVQPIEKVVNYE